MTSRTYLSIGDVLTSLREEFPDVTISKIRFLESQGLVNPERSPSGYRKFFEHDVERLRWVLRQQREHFLPLKVIRDRLAEGDLDDLGAAAPASSATGNGKAARPAHAAVGGAGAAAVAGGAGAAANAGVGTAAEHPGEPRTAADDEVMARILADASRRAALRPEAPSERAPAPPGSGTPAVATSSAAAPAPSSLSEPATAGPSPAARADGSANPRREASSTGSAGGPRGAVAGGNAGHRTPATLAAKGAVAAPSGARPAVAPGGKSTGAGSAEGSGGPAGATGSRMRAGGSAGTGTGRAPSSTTSMVTGASLTAEELCSASGLSEVELAGLQGFGLIEATMVAGIPTFDEDALTVANLAAEFRAFGIEARHLRLYRNAVDREMGLIEQVIIPLLRQRNPESRQRAVESAEQLGALGQTMRATLIRSALRRHIGG